MGALPRPVTPGPWRTVGERESRGIGIETVDDSMTGSAIVYAYGPHMPPFQEDALAIAALPERIAREDRVRALCAERIAVAERFEEKHQKVSWVLRGGSDVAADILRILDGEEGA